MTHDQYLAMINVAQGEFDIAEIIRDILSDVEAEDEAMIEQLGRYKMAAGYLEIDNKTGMERTAAADDTIQINNKIKNDYRGYIVNQQVGYFMGKAITYQLEGETKYSKEQIAHLKSLRMLNHFEAIDKAAARKCSIHGKGYRLLYFNKEANLRVMNLEPYECKVIKDISLDEVQYAMRYYTVFRVIKTVEGELKEKELTRVEWYDKVNVYYYIETDEGAGEFVLDENAKLETEDKIEIGNPQPHLFSSVPIIEFNNNEYGINDFKTTETLMDSYDLLLSNNQDEIDRFRLAYLVIIGAKIDEAKIDEIKKSGVLQVKNAMGKDVRIEYLTKEINDTFHKNQEDILKENIMRFSQTVDFYDNKFAETSGEARKFKLVSMENKAGDKQTEFTKSLRTMFRVVCQGWKEVNKVDINYEDITFTFTRNLPVDLEYYAKILNEFIKAGLPKEFAFGMMPFIGDVEAVMRMLKDEEAETLKMIEEKIIKEPEPVEGEEE